LAYGDAERERSGQSAGVFFRKHESLDDYGSEQCVVLCTCELIARPRQTELVWSAAQAMSAGGILCRTQAVIYHAEDDNG
jgi:hypothetical protein